MTWLTRWSPLEHTITAYLSNVERFERLLAQQASWNNDVGRVLTDPAKRIVKMVQEIASDETLDQIARRELNRLHERDGWHATSFQSLTLSDAQQIALLATEATGILRREASTTDLPRRSRVERAFDHLNRSLMVDPELRSRWARAFSEREERCEELGALHLLLHGVYVFKANASGGRTDLVLGGDFDITPAVIGSEALVLTEWKRVVNETEREQLADAGRVQARLYTKGVLAGVELRATRFIVLVSLANGPAIPDVLVDDVLYRHVNVVIDSDTPSKVASEQSRRSNMRRTPKNETATKPKPKPEPKQVKPNHDE